MSGEGIVGVRCNHTAGREREEGWVRGDFWEWHHVG